ncbi:MAG TPA: hypothetical protein VK131_05755 [Candidatus Acidoferrales bacterium]|nr:hypothetical protein [Candidatus Acidoferrales bacterium]
MRGWPAVGALVALAVVFAVLAALYWVGALQLFTSASGTHPKHALVMGGLALLSLIAANFVRPRPDLAS